MEGRRRRSFTQEYKQQAVELVASSGRSVTSVANELGLRDSVLRRWVDLAGRHEPTAALRRPGTQAALPPGDADFSVRWRWIEHRFAWAMPAGERGIWQRRFWEHLIRDEADDARHVECCYINPAEHGLVGRVGDWPYSSFHRDVRAGVFRPTGPETPV